MSKSIAGQTMITSFKDLIPTDSRGNSEKDPIKEIALESLVPFKNHPFRVRVSIRSKLAEAQEKQDDRMRKENRYKRRMI